MVRRNYYIVLTIIDLGVLRNYIIDLIILVINFLK